MSGEMSISLTPATNHTFNTSTTYYQAETIEDMFEIDQRELREVFSNDEVVTLAVVLGIFSVFGIIANVITFIVILVTPKLMKSVFNIFLMSLCVSDFLSAVNSPFVLYRATWGFYEWGIPAVFCKLAVSVDYWTSVVTIQHILIFSILRFISIKFPHKFNRITVFHAKIIILFVWLETCLVAFVIYFLWPGVFEPGSRTPDGKLSKACTAQPRWIPMLSSYVDIGFPVILYTPVCCVIAVTLLLSALIVKRKREKNKVISSQAAKKVTKKENFALAQLTLIIASFMLGYLPDISYRITAVTIRKSGKSLSARTEWQFSIIAHTILRLSECLNPVFYNLSSSNMRKATLGTLRRCFGIKSEQRTTENTRKKSTSYTSKPSENP